MAFEPLSCLTLVILVLLCSLPLFPCAETEEAGEKPFQFLQHLVGCHKGENVQGLHNLKKYLQTFGYLSYPNSSTRGDDDDFDKMLESAIRTYQHNYHLNVTGTLDSPTAQKMMMPRCGVPDIINGTNVMKRSGKRHGPRPMGLHRVSHYAFFTNNPRWPSSKTHLTYAFLNNAQNQVLRSTTSQAFARWAAVSHFTFEEVQDPGSADIQIGVFAREHGDGAAFDGQGGILAHAAAPTAGFLHLDGEESWSTNPRPGQFDLESVTVHEIGHLLGLGHSEVEDSIMWPRISSGVLKRELRQDDIDGVRALYNL